MYYIRKLSKHGNLDKLINAKNTASIDADILKQELGTNGNTLSFWKCDGCECIEEMEDAIKAIILSTTAIKAVQFIYIEDSIIEKYGLSVSDEEGTTGYEGHEQLHANIINLTYEKVGIVIDMLREIASNGNYTDILEKECVRKYIVQVYESGLLNKKKIDKHLRAEIEAFLPA